VRHRLFTDAESFDKGAADAGETHFQLLANAESDVPNSLVAKKQRRFI